MKKRNLILGSLITASVFASQTAVFAMPADIEEAVTSSDYNAYDHTGDYSGYDDSELISIGEDYVATVPQGGPELRFLLALPRADRPPRRGACGHQGKDGPAVSKAKPKNKWGLRKNSKSSFVAPQSASLTAFHSAA